MTSFDKLLADLADGLNTLSSRSQVAFFWAASWALRPEFRRWAAHRGVPTETLLDQAVRVAEQFAVEGIRAADVEVLLRALEEATPAGESPDTYSSTSAQDCWICADLCIRVMTDDGMASGYGVEFALEPVVSSATERAFGISQVGSGPQEDQQLQTVLRDPRVMSAIDFCRWAAEFLRERPAPTKEHLMLLRSRSTVLAP